ncbi:MarR family transcriptional regulator [Streptomyces afghaniensis]|uniref:MarR family winged helix-turn-helix transcriptional regulator n=1 Tax=Streptomyces afghaniensis TaxID=66865 RepID=UPI0033A8E0C9
MLHLLRQRPGRRIQDIAEEFSITVGGTSKVVDRLEAAGLCERRANPDDRRSSIVELTPEGRKLVDGAVKVFEEELELRIGSVIPEQSVRELTSVLGTLRAAGRALDAERKAAGQTPVLGARAPKPPGRPAS